MTRYLVTYSDGGERVFPTKAAAEAQLGHAPEHLTSDMSITPLSSLELVPARILSLESRHSTLLDYLDMVTERGDWHGVMDAAADLRDTEAEIQALKWVFGCSK